MTRDKATIRATLSTVDFSADFHTLPADQVQALIDAARLFRYRGPANANGSTARYFFAYLTRGVRL